MHFSFRRGASRDVLQSELIELQQRAPVERTGERGAELTQQLLAYSRKQTLSPKVIYLNDHITAMTSILTRSLGADIKIVQTGDADLWPCLVDPGQVENAVLNLALNARDAMPDGENFN